MTGELYIHKKRGGTYAVIARGFIDGDLDNKKRQCQYDFEARIRSVLAPIAATEGSDNG